MINPESSVEIIKSKMLTTIQRSLSPSAGKLTTFPIHFLISYTHHNEPPCDPFRIPSQPATYDPLLHTNPTPPCNPLFVFYPSCMHAADIVSILPLNAAADEDSGFIVIFIQITINLLVLVSCLRYL